VSRGSGPGTRPLLRAAMTDWKLPATAQVLTVRHSTSHHSTAQNVCSRYTPEVAEVSDQVARLLPLPLCNPLPDVCVARHVQPIKAQVGAVEEHPLPGASAGHTGGMQQQQQQCVCECVALVSSVEVHVC
jgi:hypothetical protein